MIKITHKEKDCVGCEECATICPQLFKISQGGKAHLKNSKRVGEVFELEIKKPTSLIIKLVDKAVKACPVEIIKLKKNE